MENAPTYRCYMEWPINDIAAVKVIMIGYGGLALVECVKTGHRDWISQLGLQSD